VQAQQLHLMRNAAGVVQAHLDQASFHLVGVQRVEVALHRCRRAVVMGGHVQQPPAGR